MGVITEPEVADGSAREVSRDLISGRERRSWKLRVQKPRVKGRPPWWWVLATALVVCLAWTAALVAVRAGGDRRPDLKGYHLFAGLCSDPLLGAIESRLPPTGMDRAPRIDDVGSPLRHSTTLDSQSCAAHMVTAVKNGWDTVYSWSFTVVLHKKTDPRPEFDSIAQQQAASWALQISPVSMSGSPESTRFFPGIGDRAYLSTGKAGQALTVLHGGAVLTLTVDATNRWEGSGPAHWSSQHPETADTAFVQPALPQMMRRLMGALSR
jgi:hypothetical protein